MNYSGKRSLDKLFVLSYFLLDLEKRLCLGIPFFLGLSSADNLKPQASEDEINCVTDTADDPQEVDQKREWGKQSAD